MKSEQAHLHFSATCFNRSWELLEMADRSPDQGRELVATAQASLYHWIQRPDVTPKHLSIGLWLVARVHSVLGHPEEAYRVAQDCLAVSREEELDAFCMAYAYEAVCRAALLCGDEGLAREQLAAACDCAGRVEDVENRALIDADLAELTARCGG